MTTQLSEAISYEIGNSIPRRMMEDEYSNVKLHCYNMHVAIFNYSS